MDEHEQVSSKTQEQRVSKHRSELPLIDEHFSTNKEILMQIVFNLIEIRMWSGITMNTVTTTFVEGAASGWQSWRYLVDLGKDLLMFTDPNLTVLFQCGCSVPVGEGRSSPFSITRSNLASQASSQLSGFKTFFLPFLQLETWQSAKQTRGEH